MTKDILARLSKHLDKLSGQIYDVEEQLSVVLLSTAQNATTVEKLQSIDFIRQSLEDCALLVYLMRTIDIETRIPEDTLRDLMLKLKLNTTKEIVIPPKYETREQQSVSSGGVDFF